MRDFFANLNPWIKAAIICLGVLILFLIVRQDASYETVEVEKTDSIYGPDYSSFEFDDAETVAQPVAPEISFALKQSSQTKKKQAVDGSERKPVKPSASADGIYSIQVASFKDRAQANKKAAQIKKDGFNAEVVSLNIQGKGTWHRIYIGHYKTKEQAQTRLSAVKKKYKGSFIIKRKK